MKKLLVIIILFSVPVLWAYQSVGTDTTIDIMTWNIRQFPISGNTTITAVSEIIQDLNVDLIAVQEIENVNSFNQVLSQTPGWNGLLSSHTYGDGSYDKVGIFYNKAKITVDYHRLILSYDSYNLPRPPMEITLTAQEGTNRFDFKLIVLHLKAYGDEASVKRRREAIRKLKSYLDTELRIREEKDYIVLGDFNDALEDSDATNVFTPFLADTSKYTFLTQPMAGIKGSYIFWPTPSLIDHILITADVRQEYGLYGRTDVLYLDRENADYPDVVSDHRPVLAQFSFVKGAIDDAIKSIAEVHDQFDLFKGKSVTVRGVVTLGAGLLNSEHTMAYIQDNSQAGINIFKPNEIVSDFKLQAYVEITGLVDDYNGLHEIKYQSHRLLGTDYQLPEPKKVTTTSLSDLSDQGRYIQVAGQIESIHANANHLLMINDGTGAGKVFIDKDANLQVPDWQTGDWVTFNGIKSVYQHAGELLVAYQAHFVDVPSARHGHPEGHHLLANYPNPFNNATTLFFRLQHPEKNVQIVIYNQLGAEVMRHEVSQAGAGTHQIRWQPIDLPSGFYFCQMQAGNWKQTIKMLFLK